MISSCSSHVIIRYLSKNEFRPPCYRNMNNPLFLQFDFSQSPSSPIILHKDYSQDDNFALCYEFGVRICAVINRLFTTRGTKYLLLVGRRQFCLDLPSWVPLWNWLRSHSSCLSSIRVSCSVHSLNASSDSLALVFSACHSNHYYPEVRNTEFR